MDWTDLTVIPSADLTPGDVVVALATGTAYSSNEDGRVVGVGFMPCSVQATFTVIEVAGGEVTAMRSDDRREITQRVPPGHKSLIQRREV